MGGTTGAQARSSSTGSEPKPTWFGTERYGGNAEFVAAGFRSRDVVPGGFEPPSWAPKAHMIGHYTTGLLVSLVVPCAS